MLLWNAFCLPNKKGLFISTLKRVSYLFPFLVFLLKKITQHIELQGKPEITFFYMQQDTASFLIYLILIL